jgi:hypothetical protein
MRFESPWILMRVAPQAFAIRMPCRTASYSALLFEGFAKHIRKTYRILSPCGDTRTTPAPAPKTCLEPSTYIVHEFDRSGSSGICASVHSAMKSGRTCDLIADYRWYVISHGPRVIPQSETRPIASGLLSMLETGVEALLRCNGIRSSAAASSLSCIWRMLAYDNEGTFAWSETGPR